MDPTGPPWQRWLTLLALMLAGESAFLLPFVLLRVFRPTFLDVLGTDNTTLGAAFSLYGMVAMVSYLFGGPLADRFSSRKMMTVALLATALGGLWFARFPRGLELSMLYAYWGATTILLFWAGLLRATRAWGQTDAEGQAFGLLDGGRGLVAALIATLAVGLFAGTLEGGSLDERASALRNVVLVASAFTAAAGGIVWIAVPERGAEPGERWHPALAWELLRSPVLWLQGLIVVCAYVGYKGTDDLSLLASDVLGYDDVQAASVGSLSFWLRPVSAIVAGLLADRIGSSRTILFAFGLLVVADLGVVFQAIEPVAAVLLTTVVACSAAVYGLRGVYFALFREAAVPAAATGTAVGIVSVLGYTPDVFFGPLMGWILDRAPGPAGHRDLFGVLAGFALLGLVATLVFRRMTAERRNMV